MVLLSCMNRNQKTQLCQRNVILLSCKLFVANLYRFTRILFDKHNDHLNNYFNVFIAYAFFSEWQKLNSTQQLRYWSCSFVNSSTRGGTISCILSPIRKVQYSRCYLEPCTRMQCVQICIFRQIKSLAIARQYVVPLIFPIAGNCPNHPETLNIYFGV